MKLVEILARELEVWPVDAIRASYGADMNVYFEKIDGGIIETSYFTRGVDIPPFDVTRPQWQAERDRIMGMDTKKQPGTLTEQPTYEQQLWDRVALGIQSAIFEAADSKQPLADIADSVAQYADAFMAERAKRVGK